MINLQIKERPAGYEQSLISELLAIHEKCDELMAEKIAKKAKLSLKWFDKIPPLNGEKGVKKLKD